MDQGPKYLKDEAGFCYVASELLAKLPNMTPWDGAIDSAGFAVEPAPTEAPAPAEAPAPLPARQPRKK